MLPVDACVGLDHHERQCVVISWGGRGDWIE